MALLPLPVIVFALSRWSGGLASRIGSRLPLMVGPAVAAGGIALYARPGIGGSYWLTFFPAIVVLGLGMAITVAPLTATVMAAVDTQHAGVASGINNAVARVAGLLAIAVFGVVLARAFDTATGPRVDHLHLTASSRAALDRELPKMAGADVGGIASLPSPQRAALRQIIDDGFVAAFRRVLLLAAALALIAAAAQWLT
jgi:hypothetical protein